MKMFGDKEQGKAVVQELLDNMYNLDMDPEGEATSLGMDIKYPENDELYIDIDSDEAYDLFEKRIYALGDTIYNITNDNSWVYPNMTVITQPSKSGYPRRHVTIKVKGVTFDRWQRIALQFMLGSDFIREGLSVVEAMCGMEQPTYFFEKKTK